MTDLLLAPVRCLGRLRTPSMRRVLPALLVVIGLTASNAASLHADNTKNRETDNREPAQPEIALKDIDQLRKLLRRSRKATNEALFTYVDEAVRAYRNFEKPEPPAEDASEEEKEAYEREIEKIEDLEDRHAKKAEKLFFKALDLVKLDRSSSTNQRDRFNTRAAQLVASLAPHLTEEEREDFTKRGIKVISGLEKVKYDLDEDHINALFAMLAAFDEEDAIEYILDEHIHAVKTPTKLMLMQGAHKALPKFSTRPGDLRYEVVDELIKTYSGVESQARNQDGSAGALAKKEFWDKISVDVIKVLQVYAGESASNPETGVAFAEVKQFQDWFRENKNKRKEPWQSKD